MFKRHLLCLSLLRRRRVLLMCLQGLNQQRDRCCRDMAISGLVPPVALQGSILLFRQVEAEFSIAGFLAHSAALVPVYCTVRVFYDIQACQAQPGMVHCLYRTYSTDTGIRMLLAKKIRLEVS